MAVRQVESTSHVSVAPWGTLAGGLAIGFVLSILGLVWPWLAAAVAAGVGLVVRRRFPHLLWFAAGLAGGAVAYLVLGLLSAALGQPSSGSGGS